MGIKYSKAPISEVTLGLFFEGNFLQTNGVIFKLISEIRKTFPGFAEQPAQQQQEVVGGNLQNSLDYFSSGFSSYLLINPNTQRQVLIQNNIFMFSWVRMDNEAVGNYPGFGKLYSEFSDLVSLVKSFFDNDNIDMFSHVKNYFLTYIDRLELSNYNSNPFSVLTINQPELQINGKSFSYNNVINTYTSDNEAINGHIITSLNSPTLGNTKLLVLRNAIEGSLQDYKSWFELAHTLQVSFFEQIFKQDVLYDWK